MQSLSEKHATAIEYYRSIGLSKRELQVITLAITGQTNTNICEQLSISMPTLRTHLNNIYKKARVEGGMEYLPNERR